MKKVLVVIVLAVLLLTLFYYYDTRSFFIGFDDPNELKGYLISELESDETTVSTIQSNLKPLFSDESIWSGAEFCTEFSSQSQTMTCYVHAQRASFFGEWYYKIIFRFSEQGIMTDISVERTWIGS